MIPQMRNAPRKFTPWSSVKKCCYIWCMLTVMRASRMLSWLLQRSCRRRSAVGQLNKWAADCCQLLDVQFICLQGWRSSEGGRRARERGERDGRRHSIRCDNNALSLTEVTCLTIDLCCCSHAALEWKWIQGGSDDSLHQYATGRRSTEILFLSSSTLNWSIIVLLFTLESIS